MIKAIIKYMIFFRLKEAEREQNKIDVYTHTHTHTWNK